MSVIAIVAIAKNLAIGREGKLPWHYSADLKFFKEATMHLTVLMGAKTWASIGKPLPGRVNMVLSRRKIDVPEGVMLFDNKRSAMLVADKLGSDLYLIGGAQVFKEFAREIDRWIVTEVPIIVHDADTFMPGDFLDDFILKDTRQLGDGLVAKSYDRAS